MPGPSAQTDEQVGADAPGDDPSGTVPTSRAEGWYPAACYLAIGAVLWVVVWLSANVLAPNSAYPAPLPAQFRGDFLFEGWMRYDGGWYALISAHGYSYSPGEASSVAFFPSYPLLMRLVQWVVPDPAHVLPGIMLTIACGLGASVVVYRWFRRVLPRSGWPTVDHPRIAATALLVLLLYPYAWYLYGAVYADALFLLAAVGAFFLLERDQPVLAGLVAIIATAGRPVGFGVIVGLAAVALDRRRVLVLPFVDAVRRSGWRAAWQEAGADGRVPALRALVRIRFDRAAVRVRDAGVLLSALGLGGWMWYLSSNWGDPLLFINVQSSPGWMQAPGAHTWFKVVWLANVRHLFEYLGDPHTNWDLMLLTLGWTAQAILVIGALCLVPAVVRRLGWGYAAYVVGVVGIPLLGSKDWQGTGRYLLAAFPVVLVAGGHLATRPRLRLSLLTASGALLVFLASAYARGFYLA